MLKFLVKVLKAKWDTGELGSPATALDMLHSYTDSCTGTSNLGYIHYFVILLFLLLLALNVMV